MFVIAFNIRYIDISTAVYQIRLRLWNFTNYLHSNDEYWSITTCHCDVCAIVDTKMPWLYAAIIAAWSFMKAQRKLCFFGRSLGFRRDLQASAAGDPRTILGSYIRYKVRRRKREFSNPFKFRFKFKCFIYPTEVHDIIYNLYIVRFWREGGQRSIAYRAVHLNTKTLIHEYCKLSIYHSRILNDFENSTKRKKAKVH